MNDSNADASASEAPVEGEKFGRYVLLERVGHGGMAEAFRATTSWAAGVAKEVCIKRVLPPLSSDQRLREMFIQEARIAASLTHANIVPVYEFGIIGTYYFLAMEFVEGYAIRDIMMQAAQKGVWPDEGVVLHIIHEVLEGLDYAHRKRDSEGNRLNIVHRDVTPGNVMISKEGEVKLLDFGIAAMGEVGGIERIGRGKPGYAPAEQLVGMAADVRADIFAVGVIAYEMLTHRRLFGKMSAADRLNQAREVPPPSVHNPKLSPAVDALVLKALAPEADRRYRRAAQFRDALGDFMHTEGLRAGRAQVARCMREIFDDLDGLGERSTTDLRDFDEQAPLARQPRRQRVTRSSRMLSSNRGATGLELTLDEDRWARVRGATLAALVVTLGVLAALVAWLWR